jgi:hypothetical protein
MGKKALKKRIASLLKRISDHELKSVYKVTSFCHSGLPVPDVWVSGIFPMACKKDSRRAPLAGMTSIGSL